MTLRRPLVAWLALWSATSGCTALLGDGDDYIRDASASDTGTRDATVSSDAAAHGDGKDSPDHDAGNACSLGAAGFASFGCSCASAAPGAYACDVGNSLLNLICAHGVWSSLGGCSAGQACDPQPGTSLGACVALDPACVTASVGQNFCASDGVTVLRCGPNLVSHTTVETCLQPTPVCTGGSCSCPNGYQHLAALDGGALCCMENQVLCPKQRPAVCVNFMTDPNNCGSCGRVCVGGACDAGACTCPPGQKFCSKGCTDTLTDDFNCGGCNRFCLDSCVDGVCTM